MTPNTPLISTLESYLRLTTSREQAISANMANVDTPGQWIAQAERPHADLVQR